MQSFTSSSPGRVAELEKAANQGEAEAQYNLGMMYHRGIGLMHENHAEAVEWYRKAADQGHAEAQYNLGVMYHRGTGLVHENHAEAAEWYRKAADQGHVEAQYNLGRMYGYEAHNCYNADLVRENLAKAAEWYRKAAEQGHAEAQYMLGQIHSQGCRGWIAGKKGYVRIPLGRLERILKKRTYFEAQEWSALEAAKWYRKAAEQGHSEALFRLGELYENGRGVAQSLVEAEKCYRKAAEQGSFGARDRLYGY